MPRPISRADYYWKGKHPGWAYFTAVPFGLTYTEIDAWIKYGGGQELWDELADELRPQVLQLSAIPACRWAAGSTRKSTPPPTSRA